MSPSVRFLPEVWQRFQKICEEAYPFEGCGLLLGPFEKEKIVQDVRPLRNTLRDEGRGRFDFLFAPQEFAQTQLQADKEGLDVIGIYHTHPDHPPRPSATDMNQPMLSGWINVIASVHGGKFKTAKAWWREEDGTPFDETVLQAPEI